MVKLLSRLFVSAILVITLLIGLSIYLRSGEVEVESPQEVKKEIVFTAEAQEPAKEASVEVLSPDEKYTLTMKNVHQKNGNITQTFSVYSEKDKKKVTIYEINSTPEEEIVIPFNTFAPTDKFVFLKINKPEKPEYIVLRTDGQDIKKDEKFVEITSLFYEKYSDLVITDITGWGGYSLIVVNADNKEGEPVPSFWFNPASSTFTRLSTRFN